MTTRRRAPAKKARGYGEALYKAIEAAGGAYCKGCHCYMGAGHLEGGSGCVRLWFVDPEHRGRYANPGTVELVPMELAA